MSSAFYIGGHRDKVGNGKQKERDERTPDREVGEENLTDFTRGSEG